MWEINVGDKIKIFRKTYRVLLFNNGMYLMIEMNVKKMCFSWMHKSVLEAYLNRGDARIDDSEDERYPAERLNNEKRALILMIRDEIDLMLSDMYPDWDILASKKSKPALNKLKTVINCSDSTVLRYIRKYLQSGMDEYAFADKRDVGTGVKTNNKLRGPKPKYREDKRMEDIEERDRIFEEYFQDFLKFNEKITVQELYDRMIEKYFRDTATVPPTYRQFNYFINKRLRENHLTLKQAKMNARERRNNERLLKGNARTGVFYPGQMLEIDAVELDAYGISIKDSSQIIGRPVMYCAIDVYSECIVACSMSYQNNSILGVTNLMFSLLDDHTEEAKRYGVDISPDIFPSRFIPTSIRTDQGAEYTSDEFERMCQELRITHNLVAPATGSLKGLVEQIFHQFQTLMKSQLIDAGEIYKRHNSNHLKKAVLSIEDFRTMMYNFVKYFNRHLRKDYSYTRDMIEQNIDQCPCAIWKYGIENVQSPKRVTEANRDNLYFALLRNDINFTVSAKGISHKGLYYWENGDRFTEMQMELARKGKKSMKISGIRYDPRLIDHIYRMENGKIIAIPLNILRDEQKTFIGMSWSEYTELYAKKLAAGAEYGIKDGEYRREAKRSVKKVVENKKTLKRNSKKEGTGDNVKDGIRAARKEEDREILKKDAFFGQMKDVTSSEHMRETCHNAASETAYEGADDKRKDPDAEFTANLEELKELGFKIAHKIKE